MLFLSALSMVPSYGRPCFRIVPPHARILPSQTDFERYPSFQFCDQAEPFLHGWVCSEVWQRAYKPPRLS